MLHICNFKWFSKKVHIHIQMHTHANIHRANAKANGIKC